MPKKYYKAEGIINILRQIEILVSQGQTAQMATRGVGISEQTYYRWRKEYGGMRTDQAQRLKELERGNKGRFPALNDKFSFHFHNNSAIIPNSRSTQT